MAFFTGSFGEVHRAKSTETKFRGVETDSRFQGDAPACGVPPRVAFGELREEAATAPDESDRSTIRRPAQRVSTNRWDSSYASHYLCS